MKKILYTIIDSILQPLGYGLWNRRFIEKHLNRPTLAGALEHLRKIGLEPATIIDVGVADGTRALQSMYAHVPQYLIEPLEEYLPDLEALKRENPKIEIVSAAAGHTSGTMMLNVYKELDSTSFYSEAGVDTTPRKVNVITLDDFVAENELSAPFLIKADVEGAELDVLAGSENILKQTACIILEANLFQFRENAPVFQDLIDYLSNRDFVLHDIVDLVYRPLDGALARVDLIFLPKDSALRQDTRYSTPKQRAQREAKFK